jgi:hypothetical protein
VVQGRRAVERATAAAEAGSTIYKVYCDVAEAHLSALYEAVEEDFGTYYREINAEDEGGFKAKLEPAEGKLDLEVAFYDKGMYPPGAYHSEGHQDGMGVCLYLALMKRLLGNRFSIAVLDDVVMSVDQGHRKEFCRLLKNHFPDTQFIITTHDKVWVKQMQTEDLVASTSGIAFHSWSIETGPIVEQASGVWEQIEGDIAKGDIDVASGRLRRHLEFIAGEVADSLGVCSAIDFENARSALARCRWKPSNGFTTPQVGPDRWSTRWEYARTDTSDALRPVRPSTGWQRERCYAAFFSSTMGKCLRPAR